MIRFAAIAMLAAVQGLFAYTYIDVSNRPANSWVAYPLTQMQRVTPNNIDYPNIWGVVGPSAVMDAWCGGAYDTKRNRLIVWGGGHNDYWGNEIYIFRMDTLVWERLTNPTANPVLCADNNADGTPNSRHTYSGLAYIAHADRFFGCGGALACPPGSCGANKVWTFDLATKTWHNMNPSGTGPSTQCEDNCAYDPVGKRVWYFSSSGNAGLYSYDYDRNTWTQHNSDGRYNYTCEVDPKRGLLVSVGHGTVTVYDIRNANYTGQAWTTTGGDAFISKGAVGLAYDPVSDRIVGWHGGSVYALNMDTKVWTAYTAANAPTPNSNGTFGRWRYAPIANAFIIPNRIGDNVYFYKLTAGNGSGLEKDKLVKSSAAFKASPNPFSARTTLSLDFPGSVNIFDLSGKTVRTFGRQAGREFVFDAAGLANGVYIAKATAGKRAFYQRILLQR